MRDQAVGRNLRALTAFALALLSSRLLGAEAKPLIGVDLRIEAPNFRDNLSQYIDNIQKELSRVVADLSTDRHEFLTWQPLKDVRDLSQLSAIFHVSLKDDGGVIMLRFSAEAGRAASSFDCSKGAPGTVSFGHLKDLDLRLFSRLEPQPSGDRAVLADRIRRVLADPKFRDTLGKVFTSQIPICHVAKPLEQGLVETGLKQSDLDMEEGSKMEIHLCSLDHGDNRGGTLGLDAAIRTGKYPKGPKGDLIQGRVSFCKFGGLENDSCKAKIRLMFERPLGDPEVVMIDFTSRYSCTNGSQATCPRKG